MCGFVGIAGRQRLLDGSALIHMRDTLTHRGPDAGGLWCDGEVGIALAHRRLAIIDLSDAAGQPMSDARGDVRIVYNGEIYNFRELRAELEGAGHVFRTRSDTEVIIEAYRAWGMACLDRLDGMFAFALYDSRDRRLLLARDRAGEKPLFYRHANGTLWFASELKALFAAPDFPRAVDRRALEFYLAYGFIPGEHCIIAGVRKLPPAHALSYDIATDTLRAWRYWQLPERTGEVVDADALADRLQHLLEDAVRRQLVADVPVGVLLSGGVDSSLITAAAARVAGERIRTFTVTFPGHPAHDEAVHARRIADHFGTAHTEIPADPAHVDLLPVLAAQYDEPMADSSMVPTYLVSTAIRRSATVALGGDGGDELFGGYAHYRWILAQDSLRAVLPRFVRRSMAAGARRWLPVGTRGRNSLTGYGGDLDQSIVHARLFFDEPARRELLDAAPEADTPESYLAGVYQNGRSPIRRLTGTDFLTYLPDDILVKVDRAAMLASLEVRSPMLDRRIVEFAFGAVPDRLKATPFTRKALLRRLARRVLPPDFDVKRKQGFSLPLADWFRGDWGSYLRGVLLDGTGGAFRRGPVERLFDGQARGRSNTHRLFALAMFELWRKEYRVGM